VESDVYVCEMRRATYAGEFIVIKDASGTDVLKQSAIVIGVL
jgi:hypothetical protein